MEGTPAVTAGAAGAVPPGNPPVLRAAGPSRHRRGRCRWRWCTAPTTTGPGPRSTPSSGRPPPPGRSRRLATPLGRTLPTSTYTLLDHTGAARDPLGRRGDRRRRRPAAPRSMTWLDVATASTRSTTRPRRAAGPGRADHRGTSPPWALISAHAAARGTWPGGDDRLRPLDRAGRSNTDRPTAGCVRRAHPRCGALRRHGGARHPAAAAPGLSGGAPGRPAPAWARWAGSSAAQQALQPGRGAPRPAGPAAQPDRASPRSPRRC